MKKVKKKKLLKPNEGDVIIDYHGNKDAWKFEKGKWKEKSIWEI